MGSLEGASIVSMSVRKIMGKKVRRWEDIMSDLLWAHEGFM